MAATLRLGTHGYELADHARSIKGYNKTDEKLIQLSGTSESTLKRFWNGDKISREKFISICDVLGLEWEKVLDDSVTQIQNKLSQGGKIEDDDWHDICYEMLYNQCQNLTTNALTAKDGISFTLPESELFDQSDEDNIELIDHRLIERKERKRINLLDFIPPEEETEHKKELSYQDFFKVITAKTNVRIAVIGVPGGGKTTLLQRAALQLHKLNDKKNRNKDNTKLVIWISLGDLIDFDGKPKPLEEFLLNDWLSSAIGGISEISSEDKNSFVRQFENNRDVYLFLDGIDEMISPKISASYLLTYLSNQLSQGFLAKANILISCRTNIWDLSKNTFEGFDVYEVLKFKNNDSQQFEKSWFSKAPLPGEGVVKTFLNRTDNISPLALSIFCYLSKVSKIKLRIEDAFNIDFYRKAVYLAYEWKSDRFNISLNRQSKINESLAKIAFAGIDENLTVLPYSLVLEALLPDRDMLLECLNIGLICQSGISKNSTIESVYEFWNPNFQEYFAALAIPEHFPTSEHDTSLLHPVFRDLFSDLKDSKKNNNIEIEIAKFFLDPKQKNYRILYQSRWKYVLFFWLQLNPKRKFAAARWIIWEVQNLPDSPSIVSKKYLNELCEKLRFYRDMGLIAFDQSRGLPNRISSLIAREVESFGFSYSQIRQDVKTLMQDLVGERFTLNNTYSSNNLIFVEKILSNIFDNAKKKEEVKVNNDFQIIEEEYNYYTDNLRDKLFQLELDLQEGIVKKLEYEEIQEKILQQIEYNYLEVSRKLRSLKIEFSLSMKAKEIESIRQIILSLN